MSYIPPEPADDANSDPSWSHVVLSRYDTIERINRLRSCDLLIVGGGIAGAALARIAAFNGLRTVLLERGDYASGTSSRTSKLAHGGLRYLELLDLKQVREGLASREDLFKTAPHLVQPQEFYIPVKKSDWISRCKFEIGLSIYDLLARTPRARRHRWVNAESLEDTPLTTRKNGLSGCFSFVDGIMNDTRLVMENILAARQEGALCLNYAECLSFEVRRDNVVVAGWSDRKSGKQHEIKTGIIVNCAGAWAPNVARLTPAPQLSAVTYSRGSHLLFNCKWNGPAVLTPLPGRGRNYFILPHPAGTLVGTTDIPISAPELDPIPTKEEVKELLDRLAVDLPGSGLTRANVYYGFAGIRTLPLRHSQKGSTAQISRRHEWIHTPGMMTLLGGKYTSAARTAREGLNKVFELSNVASPLVPVDGRKLPGAGSLEDAVGEFRAAAMAAQAEPALVSHAIRLFGSRVRRLLQFTNPFEALAGIVLRGAVELAIKTEQVESLEDLMRRRLDLEYTPGAGISALTQICAAVREINPELNFENEIERYKARIAGVQALFKA